MQSSFINIQHNGWRPSSFRVSISLKLCLYYFNLLFYTAYIIVITSKLNNDFCISIAFYGQGELRICRKTNDVYSITHYPERMSLENLAIAASKVLLNNSKSLIFERNVQRGRLSYITWILKSKDKYGRWFSLVPNVSSCAI